MFGIHTTAKLQKIAAKLATGLWSENYNNRYSDFSSGHFLRPDDSNKSYCYAEKYSPVIQLYPHSAPDLVGDPYAQSAIHKTNKIWLSAKQVKAI